MENHEEKSSKKSVIRNTFSLILLLIGIFILYYILIEFKTNIIIVILIAVFILLTFAGLIFRQRKTKRIYKQLFPEKKRQAQPIKRREEFRIDQEPDLKKLTEINLNFKYRRPLIKKCENCGMVIASYVKKCPI
ncbi:MAG: hypothetical protein ACFFE4_01975, partial [Candidatus Thorarchaeota archaeon]